MKVMVMVKATKDSEAGVMPSKQLLAEMGKFNEELVKAGVMLAGEGLHPSSKGKRVRVDGTSRRRIDGPFAETQEPAVHYLMMFKALTPPEPGSPPCRQHLRTIFFSTDCMVGQQFEESLAALKAAAEK